MTLPVPVRRLGYRCAYWVLRGYWFVRRPQVIGVKCLLTDSDRVLLVRHAYGPREWDLPGGGVKRGESPQAAARREMHEELGVRIEHWTHVGELRGRMYHRRDVMHCFQADLDGRAIEINLGELASARWFGRESLPAHLSRCVAPILARTAS